MKNLILAMIMLIILSACAPAATAVPIPTQEITSADLEQNALRFVEQLAAGDFAAAASGFDQTMLQVMPAAKLEQAWNQVLAQAGPFQQTSGTRREEQAGYQIIYVTAQFQNMPIDIKVVYDAAGDIAGLFFQPAASTYRAPDYADPSQFTEVEVVVGSGDWALPGTLTLPAGKGPFPAVVLVHGSGPNDRDETLYSNKPFQDIAWGLASRGIAVLRYDKRTYAHKALFTSEVMQSFTINEETVDDALLAVEVLRAYPTVDPQRIYVLGHSQGGMMLPRIGSRDANLAGLISLAGPTRPLEDITLEQMKYLYALDGELSDADKANLAALEKQVALVKSPDLSADTPAAGLLFSASATYWLDLRDYSPADVAAALSIPMLILQGGRDYQVTEADFQGWQGALSGRSNVDFKFYPALNHLFISGQGPSTPQEYQLTGHVDQQVIEDIAEWIIQ